MKRHLTVLGLALALADPALAEDKNPWVPLGNSDSGAIWSLRLEDFGRGSVDFWMKTDRSKEVRSVYRSSMTHYRMDCSGKKIGLLTQVDYKPTGETRTTGPFIYPSMQEPPPETLGETLIKVVCPSP